MGDTFGVFDSGKPMKKSKPDWRKTVVGYVVDVIIVIGLGITLWALTRVPVEPSEGEYIDWRDDARWVDF